MSKMATRWILIFTVLASLSAPLIFSQEAKDRTLDASQKQAIVDEVSKLLNQNYIFAETAKKMEEQIRGRLKNGDYDKLAGAREFAQGVSQDLSSVSKDKHLGFAYAPEQAADMRRRMSQNEDEARAARERQLAAAKRDNFGFRRVEQLAGNIGYAVDTLNIGPKRGILDIGRSKMDGELIPKAADILRKAKRVAALTGAGISAESGVPTFRGKDGLWRQFRAEDLASPEAFAHDPKLVWEWYDWRRGLIAGCAPNPGHNTLAKWEKVIPDFILITQNVDGLHPLAGTTNLLELHGNIWKVRCAKDGTVSDNRDVPLREIPPRCPDCGALLRPHIVWFGEMLDQAVIGRAVAASAACEVMLVVGTSAIVHPAASLPLYAAEAGAAIIEINPDPTPLTPHADVSLRGPAGEILPLIDREF